MKEMICGMALLAASACAAEAKCSTASLNGSWTVFASSTTVYVGTITSGAYSFPGARGAVTLGLNCRGTATFSALPNATGKITVERIAPTSNLKPNLMTMVFEDGMTSIVYQWARR